MSRLAFEAVPFALDGNGDSVSGAKLYVYAAGTTTAATVYSDSGLTTPHASPIVADSAGVFAQIYAATGDYKVIITDTDDVTLYEADNIRQAEEPVVTVVRDNVSDLALLTSDEVSLGQVVSVLGNDGRYVRVASGGDTPGADISMQNLSVQSALTFSHYASQPTGTRFSVSGHEYVADATVVLAQSAATKWGVAGVTALPGTKGYDVRAFGAADDWNGVGGTDNFAIFELIAGFPKPVSMYLPKVGTGDYRSYGHTTHTDLSGLTINADDGVAIAVDFGTPITYINGIKADNDLRTKWTNVRIETSVGEGPKQRPTDLHRPGGVAEGELVSHTLLDFSDARHLALSSWPSGSWATASPVSIAAEEVNWGLPTSTSFVGTTFAVVPGDVIEAKGGDDTTYLHAIVVLLEDGWCLVRQDLSAPQNLIVTKKIGVASAVEYVSYNQSVQTETYRFNRGSVGVVVFDHTSFGLVVNGVVIRRFSAGGNIVEAGWAYGFATAGTAKVSKPVLSKGRKHLGIKPLGVLCIGDSTADRLITQWSQFDYMRSYLAGMAGAQVVEFQNIANAGDHSQQQLWALQNLTLTPVNSFDYCLIQIGINDVQSGRTVSEFLTAVEGMITECRDNDIEPIVGVPAMWYSQASAQAYSQDGTNTVDADLAAPYRLALMRKLSELDVFCNTMTMQDMGSILPSLLSRKPGPWGDQMLTDNIHPTAWGSMVQGFAWAKALVAHMTNGASKHGCSYLPDWYFAGGTGVTSQPKFTIDGRTLKVFGPLSTGGTLADGTVIGTLPERMRPDLLLNFSCVSSNGSQEPLAADTAIQVAADGVMKIFGAHASASFIEINVSWVI